MRLAPEAPVPEWTLAAVSFLSVTRTPEELSIVVDAVAVPAALRIGPAYVALRVHGPLALDLVGIFAALAGALAAASIPIFPIATHDTDYLLVREEDANAATEALAAEGHRVFEL